MVNTTNSVISLRPGSSLRDSTKALAQVSSMLMTVPISVMKMVLA